MDDEDQWVGGVEAAGLQRLCQQRSDGTQTSHRVSIPIHRELRLELLSWTEPGLGLQAYGVEPRVRDEAGIGNELVS